MLKETKKGDQEMPAHSTMCIWHIGLACLDLPQPLRIKNSVYVHNSRSYHTNFLPLIPSHSYNFPRFSHFAWCEMREDWSWGWVENERMEGKKWENAATRNIQNNVYFNVFCLPMSPCSLTLSLTFSMTKEWDVHKGQIGDTFFSGCCCCCRWNVSIWQGRVMCCLAWKSTTQDDAPLPSIHSQNSFVWEWDEGQGICKVVMICIHTLSFFRRFFLNFFLKNSFFFQFKSQLDIFISHFITVCNSSLSFTAITVTFFYIYFFFTFVLHRELNILWKEISFYFHSLIFIDGRLSNFSFFKEFNI